MNRNGSILKSYLLFTEKVTAEVCSVHRPHGSNIPKANNFARFGFTINYLLAMRYVFFEGKIIFVGHLLITFPLGFMNSVIAIFAMVTKIIIQSDNGSIKTFRTPLIRLYRQIRIQHIWAIVNIVVGNIHYLERHSFYTINYKISCPKKVSPLIAPTPEICSRNLYRFSLLIFKYNIIGCKFSF